MAQLPMDKEHNEGGMSNLQSPISTSMELQSNDGKLETQNDEPEPPYSIFTPGQKAFIVAMASLAALFSPLSTNIYYPALNILATDLNVSKSLINLSISTYLIFQGLAPSFIGSLSDETGRRPSYILCFIIYFGACMGLALQNSFAALLVLRCLQSAGSSGTVALANAVVADIVTTSERGKYIGYASMGAMLGPVTGPIIGGLINQYLGWRWIFWVLTIFAGITLVVFLLLMPETCRKIVGNGSFPPQKWNISGLDYFARRRARQKGSQANEKTRLNFKARPNPLDSIYIILDKESGLILLYMALIFAGYNMVITSMPSQFEAKYGFNSLQIGLCYIPAGFGSFTAAILTGRFIDWNFRRLAKQHDLEIDKTKQQDLTNFPIEVARLQVVLPFVLGASVFAVAYGWVMHAHTNLAGPLILIFFLTFCLSSAFQSIGTLVVDLNRDAPGTATAAMNLGRCWLAAGGTAMVIPMLNKMGIGWVSVFVACVWVLLSPISLLVMKKGPRWRAEKRERMEKEKEKALREASTLTGGAV